MRLLSITAKNFRSLQDLHLNFSRSYCTISGKNNAGKSSVIRLLLLLFGAGEAPPWSRDLVSLDYKDDLTQWSTSGAIIEVVYRMELDRDADPALISFIEKMASRQSSGATVCLDVQYLASDTEDLKVSVTFDGQAVESKASKEINKKIRDSNSLFLYNSTTRDEPMYYSGGRRRRFYDFVMSHVEEKELEEAGRTVDKKLRRIAKQHTQGLNAILGRLIERFVSLLAPWRVFRRGILRSESICGISTWRFR